MRTESKTSSRVAPRPAALRRPSAPFLRRARRRAGRRPAPLASRLPPRRASGRSGRPLAPAVAARARRRAPPVATGRRSRAPSPPRHRDALVPHRVDLGKHVARLLPGGVKVALVRRRAHLAADEVQRDLAHAAAKERERKREGQIRRGWASRRPRTRAPRGRALREERRFGGGGNSHPTGPHSGRPSPSRAGPAAHLPALAPPRPLLPSPPLPNARERTRVGASAAPVGGADAPNLAVQGVLAQVLAREQRGDVVLVTEAVAPPAVVAVPDARAVRLKPA